MDEIKVGPKQRARPAKGNWSHLPEGEAVTSREHKQMRSGLSQKRAAIALDDVDKQIRNSFRRIR